MLQLVDRWSKMKFCLHTFLFFITRGFSLFTNKFFLFARAYLRFSRQYIYIYFTHGYRRTIIRFYLVLPVSLIIIIFFVTYNFLHVCACVVNVLSFKLHFIWIQMISFDNDTILYVLGHDINQLRDIHAFVKPSLNGIQFLILFFAHASVRLLTDFSPY